MFAKVAALMLPAITLCQSAMAVAGNDIQFSSDFELGTGSEWSFVYGCERQNAVPRSGEGALHCGPGTAVLISSQGVAELGMLELWLKPDSVHSRFKLSLYSSESGGLNSIWTPVAVLEGEGDDSYQAQRIAIDEAGQRFLRLDIETQNGGVSLDDIRIDKIQLNAALAKNERRIIGGLLEKIKEDQDYKLQSDSIATMARSFAGQLESQRQYLEYANGIYSSITFVLATSERNKMANPLVYKTFKGILNDTKRVATPLQEARLNSMIKPFGDLVGATLKLVSAGTYAVFAEPFKSFLAATFDKSNIDNSDLSRSDKKFARENGLAIYERAEKFMTELERELGQTTALDNDLGQILKNIDSFRKDLERFMGDTMQYADLGRNQENRSALMSKDDASRAAIQQKAQDNIARRANALADARRQTDLVQYLLRTSGYIETTQGYKERFNQITAQVLSFYDRFERSVAPEANPFSEGEDRKLWEQHAVRARAYIKDSRAAFQKAYM
ncbi:BAR domain-like protein A BdpA [Shewanella cyperi]|nr:exo-alpha-sialidase [Shewanella cyperi]